jgi:hypothetical protein
MAFSQASITELRIVPSGGDLLVSWSSSAAAGTTYQVYIGRRLAWYGQALSIRQPMPAGQVTVEVGTVNSGEGASDFSASLPTAPLDRVILAWPGVTTDPYLAGYHVYSSSVPGGAVDYATILGNVPAFTGTVGTNANYAWTSLRLAAGSWTFAIRPYDRAGNEGTADTIIVVSAAPPLPPALNAERERLTYSYDASSRVVTLNWRASPG